jgi:hypothetical protein
MSDTPTQRYVPGAPPPVPTSKSSKKKRKTGKGSRSEDSPALSSVAIPDSTSAALVENAPDSSDIKDGPVADSLLADPYNINGIPSGQAAQDQTKHTPIVDLIQKRIKTTSKKIVRLFLCGSHAYKCDTAADSPSSNRLEYKAMQRLTMKN